MKCEKRYKLKEKKHNTYIVSCIQKVWSSITYGCYGIYISARRANLRLVMDFRRTFSSSKVWFLSNKVKWN